MLAVAAAEVQGEGCSGSGGRCGNLAISDPFWLVDTDTGRSCGSGSADFEVGCYNKTPILRGYGLAGFWIANISYEEHSLRAIDLGMLNLLKVSNTCDILPSWNTSAKLGRPFQISSNNMNLIMYNCTEAAHLDDRGLVETKMGCRNQHKVFVSVEGLYEETRAIKGCDACIVPVLGSLQGKANASHYKQLISNGFLLTWDSSALPPLASKSAQTLTRQIIFKSSLF
jgi:hypothetical protein